MGQTWLLINIPSTPQMPTPSSFVCYCCLPWLALLCLSPPATVLPLLLQSSDRLFQVRVLAVAIKVRFINSHTRCAQTRDKSIPRGAFHSPGLPPSPTDVLLCGLESSSLSLSLSDEELDVSSDSDDAVAVSGWRYLAQLLWEACRASWRAVSPSASFTVTSAPAMTRSFKHYKQAAFN